MSQFHCTVAADDARGAVAREVCETLASNAAEQFSVDLTGLPLAGEGCDLLLPIADSDNAAQLAADILVWRAQHPHCSVLPVTVELSQHQVLVLLASGAFDFAAWPCNGDALLARTRRALGVMPAPPNVRLREVLSPAVRELVGSSPAFVKQLTMLPTLAGCDAGVLILGETGSGKEVYARAIHYTSARSTRPLVAMNCGAIPAELLESELFGHVRGAFSNAYNARAGLVREAEGGTLFLDEVDALPLPAQAKLLRFLHDMEYRPVGSDSMQHANVRVIAASNQDLAGLMEQGRFRRDLFFRLHVLTVTLPPLRERAEDICALAVRFMQQFAKQSKRPTLGLSPQSVKLLLAHDWPGNVRELKHVMERAVLMAETSTIQAEDLQLPVRTASLDAEQSFRAAKARTVDAFERCYIERLLASSRGNITLAAQMAKKNRRAFFALIRKHGISTDRFRSVDDTIG